VFHRALDEAPEARAAFVEAACAGDDALRDEVRSLLAAHDAAGHFIEQSTISAADLFDLADTDAASLVGREIGHYRVKRVLGEGGMGIVYLAEDTRLGRSVALKAVAPRFTSDPARRERLIREARAAAGLTHPGIATVYALEEFGDQLYIAGEYVPGETLRSELDRGPLSPARVIDTAIGIARALAAAHDRGVVHRDLKPENVMRTPGGEVKILDFGLARFRDLPQALATLTGDGTLLGTPAYMSPEQIRGEAVDFRSDLFSLGIVLYELASGAHPFAGSDPASTIARILEAQPRRLALVAPEASGAAALGPLEAIITICLRKPADARYRSTHEFITALEAARTAAASGLPAPSGRASTDAASASARHPLWWWQFHQAAASLGYGVLLAPLWLVHEWRPGRMALLLFLGGLVAALVASTLRLHLWFAVRSYPGEWAAQRQSTAPWIRLADTAFAAALLAGSALVLATHASVAVLLVGAAVAVVLSALVIEPATTRAAFTPRTDPATR
jgi:predicted Ser/Thr protein kinase